jgi:glyceraldehyde 3-phosphate dehydrogenase
MALKIAINGFGRIGRCVARIIAARQDVELVAINDLAHLEMLAYLLKYDSVHGRFDGSVEVSNQNTLKINGREIRVFAERDPSALTFSECGAEVMLECTGLFATTEKNECHLRNGLKKVIISAPAKDETPTYVLGVNAHQYKGESIISNASCTTNCLAPVAKLLHEQFDILKGNMTTIHSYTNDQRILDVMHPSDQRRARAGAVSMIPTTTGAAKAVGKVMPELKGKLHGHSVRVPTPNVSMVDLNVLFSKQASVEAINETIIVASQTTHQGIIGIDYDKCVSADFMTTSQSAIFVPDLTVVMDGDFIKVMSWYDNEYGYSNRLVDMAVHISC